MNLVWVKIRVSLWLRGLVYNINPHYCSFCVISHTVNATEDANRALIGSYMFVSSIVVEITM